MKDDAKPDLKESFIWGYEYQSGEVEDHPIRGENKWPSFIPNFKENALNCYDNIINCICISSKRENII